MFDDFIVDDHAGTNRYMVIDTRNWLPGKKSLQRRSGSPLSIGRTPTFTSTFRARQ
jgi:hypothetical protein